MRKNLSERKDLSALKRVAVMGGSFDPIHFGHLAAAEAVRCQFHMQRVLFIPTGNPPHKCPITSADDRCHMTQLAVAGHSCFDVSRMEIDRPGATHTVDTLKELRMACGPKTKIYFIAGADALEEMTSWNQAERLFSLCAFVAATRPGCDREALEKRAAAIRTKYRAQIYVAEVPALDISSSNLRERVRNGQSIKYLTPDAVEEYIRKHDLYREDIDLDAAWRLVENALSEKRWLHTQGVMETAVRLAERYGVSRRKAYTAGLLHDCAKEIPHEEKRALCGALGVQVDDIMSRQMDLTHGFLGAAIARRDCQIEDKAVLNAICYHTTGRKKMALLEKVLFIADMIEPGREDYEGLTEIRGLAYSDIDKAVLCGLQSKIFYTKIKGKQIHPFTLEALEELEADQRESGDGS
ncbi:MAG: nicotinate-nucleotide adenylyltransferase [Clostridiales bacterium]|jgi:nicotinate-nucleotide adenylyltransferase|nr:nicotinate-nucleotide adenylyltransferase [Clostridiales bacterium]